MGQFNLGTMTIGTPYGANSSGSSRNTSTVSASESFDKTFDRAKTSTWTNNDPRSTKNATQNDDSKKNVVTKRNENPYENKEVKNEGDTKATQKADSEDEKINESLQVEEESTDEVIDNQILSLVSQALHLSVDEIKEVLGQLGLEIQDLMNQEGFSTFISEACGQGSIAALLMETDDLKGIATLFEDLNALGDNLQEAMLKNSSKETLINELQQKQISETYTEDTSKIDNELNGLQVVQTEGYENINVNVNEEVNLSGVKENVRYNENTEASDEGLSFLQGSEEQTEDLGINVPVHNFTTTTFTQSFETEGAIVTQTLEEQGLNVADVKVDIRQDNHQSQMEQERQKSSKRIQEIISKHFGEEDEEEYEDIAPIASDSEVDYMV